MKLFLLIFWLSILSAFAFAEPAPNTQYITEKPSVACTDASLLVANVQLAQEDIKAASREIFELLQSPECDVLPPGMMLTLGRKYVDTVVVSEAGEKLSVKVFEVTNNGRSVGAILHITKQHES